MARAYSAAAARWEAAKRDAASDGIRRVLPANFAPRGPAVYEDVYEEVTETTSTARSASARDSKALGLGLGLGLGGTRRR